MCPDQLSNPMGPFGAPEPTRLGKLPGVRGDRHWVAAPLCLSLVTLTMALGEGGAGLEALITVALEAARSVDAAAVGTESGLGAALILI